MDGPQVLGTQRLVTAGRWLGNFPGSIARFTPGCQSILHHVDSDILHLSPSNYVPTLPALQPRSPPQMGCHWAAGRHLHILWLLVWQLPYRSAQLPRGGSGRPASVPELQGSDAHLPVVTVGSFIKIDFSLATIQKFFNILTINTAAFICSGWWAPSLEVAGVERTGYVLKVDLTGFANRWNVRYERCHVWLPDFGLSDWKKALLLKRKHVVLDTISFRWVLDIPMEFLVPVWCVNLKIQSG